MQVTGRNGAANLAYAEKLMRQIARIPGLADTRIQQSARYPQLNVDVKIAAASASSASPSTT